jgi:hypothetical protein
MHPDVEREKEGAVAGARLELTLAHDADDDTAAPDNANDENVQR